MKMRILVAMALVALVPLAAFGQGTVEPQRLIVSGVSVGPIRLGMTIADVRAILGKETYVLTSRDGAQKSYAFSAPGTAGLRVHTKDDRVIGITAYLDPAYRTNEGIGVGSTADDVEKVYGLPQRQHQSQAQAGIKTVAVLYIEYDIGLFMGIDRTTNLVLYIGVHAAK
jgi:hypothetical protein